MKKQTFNKVNNFINSMAIVSVSVDEATRKKMKQHDHLNWSAVAREAFKKKLEELELFEQIVSKSTLTEQDANTLAEQIKQNIAQRHEAGY